MLFILSFSCQSRSSIAIMNSQAGLVYFKSTPSSTLNNEEKSSCLAQTNKTAIVTIIIGGNTFRSKFIMYNAFVDQDLSLYPDNGSSVITASLYSVAKYQITFLENELIQESAIGQLQQAFFNFNECFPSYEIKYETNKYIQPYLAINPNCKISVDADMNYQLFLNDQLVLSQNITSTAFNFSTLQLGQQNCTSGTAEQQESCKLSKNIISRDKFVYIKLVLIFPQQITTQNIYKDSYGLLQTETLTSANDLTFNFAITSRESSDSCSTYNALGFLPSSLFIKQNIIPNCEIKVDPHLRVS